MSSEKEVSRICINSLIYFYFMDFLFSKVKNKEGEEYDSKDDQVTTKKNALFEEDV